MKGVKRKKTKTAMVWKKIKKIRVKKKRKKSKRIIRITT